MSGDIRCPGPDSVRPRRLRLLRESLAGARRFARGLSRMDPARQVVVGYLSWIVLGAILLRLPFAQEGAGAGFLDCLFTAASAVSTTGLGTVSLADSHSMVGEILVLLLIQAGGIGYMTLGSFFILSRRDTLPPAREGVGRTVFSLPESFRLDRFIRSVIRFTFAIEAVGAAALYVMFREAGVPSPLWSAVFHSVSSFCTAGFSLCNDSIVPFAGHFGVNAVIGALALLGAVGFIVCSDLTRVVLGRSRQVTLTTKIILWATFWCLAAGTALLFLGEPTLADLPPEKRLLAAFFQAMTAQTTVGFNSVPIAAFGKASVLVLIVLMVVGSSPSGTGGGMKVTTVTAVLGVMRSALRGEREAKFRGKVIPQDRVFMAVATVGFYVVTLVAGTYLLELTERTPFDRNFFEVASALGTVGLSLGITPGLSTLGKVIIIATMFCGRVGPLTLGMALFTRRPGDPGPRDTDLAV